MDRVAVVGAGLVGPVAALFLARRGFHVDLYERSSNPGARASAQRSINLTLCHRGFAALDSLGLAPRVRRLCVPAYGRAIHAPDGTSRFDPYGSRGEALFVVARARLNAELIAVAAADSRIDLHFGTEITARTLDALLDSTRVVAADGANSYVRSRLAETGRTEVTQVPLPQGYRELTIPPDRAGSWRLDPNAIHLWPRGHFMLMAFANADGSFTVALHLPLTGDSSFASLRSEADLSRLFANSFPKTLQHIPDLARQFFTRPTARMSTVRCAPWIADGRVVLIGDAAHALVPFYGQGANAGFEDCAVLAACLDEAGHHWPDALAQYQARRKPDADVIADLALAHLQQLQQASSTDDFVERQAIERRLHELHPDRYTPLYSMIAFTTMSYGEAYRRHLEQRPLLERVLAQWGASRDVDDAIDIVRFA